MAQKIDSGLLVLKNEILNSSGGGSDTLLDDENITQVLNVNEIGRRSLAPIGSEGWFVCIHQNVHGAGATSLTTSQNPYQAGAVGIPPFPGNVRAGLDFWLLGAGLEAAAATATNLTDATLSLNVPRANFGYGVDDMGAAVNPTDVQVPLVFWDNLNKGVLNWGEARADLIWQPIKLRIPRKSAAIRFDSTAANAVTVNCLMICALLPSGLGQDVVT